MDTNGLMQDTYTRWGLVAVFALLALFLLGKTITEFTQLQFVGSGVQPSATIHVQGEGEVLARPDVAEFSYSVIAEADTVAAAQEMATETGNEAVAFLEGEGIPAEDIKTTGYNVYPRYDYVQQTCREGFCPPGERVLQGFEVRQTVRVRTEDLEGAGALLSGLGSIGVSEISGLSFVIDEDEAVRTEARDKAIADAQEKAEQLADALGVELVRVVSYNEAGKSAAYRVEEAYGLGGAADASSAPQLPTGENRIVSNVSVTYEIR